MNIEDWEDIADRNIANLMAGNVEAKTANAVSNALGKRLTLIGKELDYMRLHQRRAIIPFMERRNVQE